MRGIFIEELLDLDAGEGSEALAAVASFEGGFGGEREGKRGWRCERFFFDGGCIERAEAVKDKAVGVLDGEHLDIGLGFFGARTVGLFGRRWGGEMFEVPKGQVFFDAFLAVF